MRRGILAVTLAALAFSGWTSAQVVGHQKVSNSEGGFFRPPRFDGDDLDASDEFGNGDVCSIGDFDGDGIEDLAVGAWLDDDGGRNRGALWLLLLNSDGTVKSHRKISDTAGGFSGVLDDGDGFGFGVDSIGDFDGDSVTDLAVGALHDDDGGGDRGAVWLLFLNRDGTVKSHQKISDTEGGFSGVLDNSDLFGTGVANVGDLDGDTVVDLAVGAVYDDDGGSNRGAIWLLFLNPDGTVKSHQKISDTRGGFHGGLGDGDHFGVQVAYRSGPSNPDDRVVAVGARLDDDGGWNRGAVWVLSLNPDGTVKSHAKISDTEGGLSHRLEDGGHFGKGLAWLPYDDPAGMGTLAVGAPHTHDGGRDRGAIFLVTLDSAGAVVFDEKVSATTGGFSGKLDDGDLFGGSATFIEVTSDKNPELVVGAFRDDDGASDAGAAWVLFLEGRVRIDSINPSRARYDRPHNITLKGEGFAHDSEVYFNSRPATNVVVLDDHTITCDTPLAEPGGTGVDITVTNADGDGVLEDAFTFTPSLAVSGDWAPGGELTLDYLLDVGDSLLAIYGVPPEQSIDTPPYDGQLCILPFSALFLISDWPFDSFSVTIDIPDDPAFSGLDVLFQGLIGPSFGVPKDAAWTNCETVTIR